MSLLVPGSEDNFDGGCLIVDSEKLSCGDKVFHSLKDQHIVSTNGTQHQFNSSVLDQVPGRFSKDPKYRHTCYKNIILHWHLGQQCPKNLRGTLQDE